MLTPLITNLGFAEGLRWFDGKLWFSDFLTRKIQTADLEGRAQWIGFIPGQPSGLGFSSTGELLTVSMMDRKILNVGFEQLGVFADLSGLATPPCNDMLVITDGTAFVGTFSYELWYETGVAGPTSVLIKVSPDGTPTVAADSLHMPNGITLLPDGKTLVVAETGANQLTAFTLQNDRTLTDRRIFAALDCAPDGICCDANGDVWVSGLYSSKFLKVREGGKILDTLHVPGCWAVACELGGNDGNRLFCATTTVNNKNDLRMGRCTSSIAFIDVEVPAL